LQAAPQLVERPISAQCTARVKSSSASSSSSHSATRTTTRAGGRSLVGAERGCEGGRAGAGVRRNSRHRSQRKPYCVGSGLGTARFWRGLFWGHARWSATSSLRHMRE
jgi:hypothetical protein